MRNREILILRVWLVLSFTALAWLLVKEFTRDSSISFKIIEAQRINIRETDGTLRLAISNKELQDVGNVDGETIHEKGSREAGMIFFNDLGDEMGGLIFGGKSKDNTGGSLTFDRWKNDQTIQLLYSDFKSKNYTGLIISDRPNDETLLNVIRRQKKIKELGEEKRKLAQKKFYDEVKSKKIDMGETRVFAGVKNGVAQFALYDAEGKLKIRISAGPKGIGKFEAFDDDGNVIKQ